MDPLGSKLQATNEKQLHSQPGGRQGSINIMNVSALVQVILLLIAFMTISEARYFGKKRIFDNYWANEEDQHEEGRIVKPNSRWTFNQNVTDIEVRDFVMEKKGVAVILMLLAGLIIALVINFANLNNDFHDLNDFYRGYMGRKMQISEGSLTSRRFLETLKAIHDQYLEQLNTDSSGKNGTRQNGDLLESIETLMREKDHSRSHSNTEYVSSFKPFIRVIWLTDPESLNDVIKNAMATSKTSSNVQMALIEWLLHHLPLSAGAYLEDDEAEWRHLDYSIMIGEPPVEAWRI